MKRVRIGRETYAIINGAELHDGVLNDMSCAKSIVLERASDGWTAEIRETDGEPVGICINGVFAVAAALKSDRRVTLRCNGVDYLLDRLDSVPRLQLARPELAVSSRPCTQERADIVDARFVRFGSGHIVCGTRRLDDLDIVELGFALGRRLEESCGVNVHAYELQSESNRVRVRTFERGPNVEAQSSGAGALLVGMSLEKMHAALPRTVRYSDQDAYRYDFVDGKIALGILTSMSIDELGAG